MKIKLLHLNTFGEFYYNKAYILTHFMYGLERVFSLSKNRLEGDSINSVLKRV